MRSDMKEIITHVAYCGMDENRFCGHSVFNSLITSESFLGMTALSLLNRRIAREEQQLLDLFSVILTAADPRIWPLKAGRLVAVYGSPESGLLASSLCLIGSKMGPQTVVASAALLQEIRSNIDFEQVTSEALCDTALTVMKKHRFVPGFGAPGRKYDKRLLVLDEHIQRLKRHDLPYYQIKTAMIGAARRLSIHAPPNISLGIAAACLDIGFEPADLGLLSFLLATNTFLANTAESAREPAADIKHIPENRVRYVGPLARQSPRKRQLTES